MIVGLDTSTEMCSVALLKEERVLGEINIFSAGEHASRIIPLLDKILKENNLLPGQIKGIAVSIGPGGFTGLRVGIATAKGLAQGLNIPLAGISSLEALAYNFPYTRDLVCAVMDAKKKEIYAAFFKPAQINKEIKLKRISRDACLGMEDLFARWANLGKPAITFSGNGLFLYKEIIKKKMGEKAFFAPSLYYYPRASIVAFLGRERLKKKKADSFYSLRPHYLRRPETRKPDKEIRSFLPA